MFKPNQRVKWTFKGVEGWKNLFGRIVGPGDEQGTWRVHLEDQRTTIQADEKDLVAVSERDY